MNTIEKHLEFTLGVINRMAQNSFLIKGWTVTLVSALLALDSKNTDKRLILIAYFPAVIFWFLDGYFLYQERLFRKVYDHVRQQKEVDYSLSTEEFETGLYGWLGASFSKTVFPFYVIIVIVIIALSSLN